MLAEPWVGGSLPKYVLIQFFKVDSGFLLLDLPSLGICLYFSDLQSSELKIGSLKSS